MIKRIRINDAKRQAFLIRSSSHIPQNSLFVQKIINDVIKFGDKAIIKYTKKFDNVKIDSILVEKVDFRKAYRQVTTNQLNALKKTKKLLEKNEKMLLDRLTGIITSEQGVKIERRLKPIESIGCYVPGGKARYPSTLIMCAVPALVANVGRIAMVSPPMKDGNIDPLTLVAADICDIDEVYRIGGAQAVAALAYGTKTISKVDKIVGDIKELKDGTTARIITLEQQMNLMEKIRTEYDPTKIVPLIYEHEQWIREYKLTYKIIVGVAAIIGAIVSFALKVVFDIIRITK